MRRKRLIGHTAIASRRFKVLALGEEEFVRHEMFRLLKRLRIVGGANPVEVTANRLCCINREDSVPRTRYSRKR